MLPVGENLALQGEEYPRGVNEIHDRKSVLDRDLLAAEVLLAGHGNHAPAFTVASLATMTDSRPWILPDAQDGPRAGHPRILVHFPGGEEAYFKERLPGSIRCSIRSRALIFPLFLCFSSAAFPTSLPDRLLARPEMAEERLQCSSFLACAADF